MFDEAIEGMTPGSKRRVLIAPESRYSALGDMGETVDFEIELIEVITGGKKAAFLARRAGRELFNLFFFYNVAQFVLEATGIVPHSGQAPPMLDGHAVDVANAWAAAGLSNVGL